MFGATSPTIRQAVEREEYLLDAFACDNVPLPLTPVHSEYAPTLAELSRLELEYSDYLIDEELF